METCDVRTGFTLGLTIHISRHTNALALIQRSLENVFVVLWEHTAVSNNTLYKADLWSFVLAQMA